MKPDKYIKDSLSFLDNFYVKMFIIVFLILYIIGVAPNLTQDIAVIFDHPIVKVLFVILIAYIGFKDPSIAMLLAIAFILSLLMGYRFQFGFDLSKQGVGIEAGISAEEAEKEAQHQQGAEGFMNDNSDTDGGNYNHYFDCVKANEEGTASQNPECQGVGYWNKELNTQGLNNPLGYSGTKVGAHY